LHVIELEGDDASRPIAKAWHRSLDWTANGILAVRSGAKTPPQVVQYAEPLTADDGTRTIVTTASTDNVDGLVEPVPVTWTRDGMTLHGLWWMRPAADGLPPVLVHLHGGPTDQATADWDVRRQYFVQRGWALFTPNPRGSTGYGRSYVDGVRGGWGVVDLADVVAGIEQVIPRLGGDPDRVVAMGGSAGGYLVLRLCTEYPDLLDAAISVYGVTDLLGLASTTWRRESGYEDWLVGPLPEFEAEYRKRSPLFGADRIRTPLLLLQGDADQVVNISQYEALLGAVQASGTPVEGHVYAGEGHGFSKPETKVDEVQRIEAFLARMLRDCDAVHDVPTR
jgi:dipeptidyl aminopeptidase/acylaminoacyl peptidase